MEQWLLADGRNAKIPTDGTKWEIALPLQRHVLRAHAAPHAAVFNHFPLRSTVCADFRSFRNHISKLSIKIQVVVKQGLVAPFARSVRATPI